VDTKYEMGLSEDGQILLIDEIHTPDSSRYWLQPSYERRFKEGKEPENVDKEFLRLWFRENCNPYKDETLPKAPQELVIELAARYIHLFETITGQTFQFPDASISIMDRIKNSL
jgi:phosphoribosylaminoimidazole-succinocarboxamide synthase